jgi:uncharacterized protein YodC (DUF2158 family)
VGAIVRKKSGGPLMKVGSFDKRNGKQNAECNWSEGDNLRTAHFALDDLDIVPPTGEAQPILNRRRGMGRIRSAPLWANKRHRRGRRIYKCCRHVRAISRSHRGHKPAPHHLDMTANCRIK